MLKAGEAVQIEYEYPVEKPDQVTVKAVRTAGKMMFIHYQGRGAIRVKPDTFNLGGGREWAYLW